MPEELRRNYQKKFRAEKSEKARRWLNLQKHRMQEKLYQSNIFDGDEIENKEDGYGNSRDY